MNKAVFIILDNVLTTTKSGKDFPLSIDDWKFTRNWFDIFNNLIKEDYKIVIIDNQYSVGSKGFITERSFNGKIETICSIMEKDLSLAKNSIITNFAFEDNNAFRVIPNPGLLYEVALDYNITLGNSILIGNTVEHQVLAHNARLDTFYNIDDL